jgi:hypothetical protein
MFGNNSSTTLYYSPINTLGISATNQTQSTTYWFPMPACTVPIGGFTAVGNVLSSPAPSGNTVTNVLTILKAPVGSSTFAATPATCTVTASGAANTVGSCSNAASATFNAGDILMLQAVQNTNQNSFVKMTTAIRCQ